MDRKFETAPVANALFVAAYTAHEGAVSAGDRSGNYDDFARRCIAHACNLVILTPSLALPTLASIGMVSERG